MKEKKKVLIITYFYLPIRRSVSYRVRVWAECLSRLGWEPVILTRHWDKDTMDPFEQDFTPVTEGMDPEINCRVYRTPCEQSFKKIAGLRGRISGGKIGSRILNFVLLNFFFYPDGCGGWYKYAYEAGVRIIREERISAIFSIGPPWTDHRIAGDLSRQTGVKWVADYRDKWTQLPSSGAHKKRAFRKKWFLRAFVSRLIEKRISGSAHCITHASEPWAAELHKLLKINVRPLIYGVDKRDFADLRRHGPDSRVFTVSYVGTMHFTQKPEVFFKGFEKFVLTDNVPPDRCRLRFIGARGIEEICGRYGSIKNHVDIIPYAAREEAMKYMLRSHVLLLFLIDDDGWYPMKTFEYLMTNNQILATPDDNGVVRELLRRTRAGVTLNTPEEVADWLGKKFREFRSSGCLRTDIDAEALREFSREKQMAGLAEILEEAANPNGQV